MAPKQNVLIVGISGVSSSGKTTLARLLRDIWPRTFILHEDDFYWPDTQIPVKNGIQDWDCIEAIDLEKLLNTIQYIKKHGKTPADLQSKEDQNSVGDVRVDAAIISQLRDKIAKLVKDCPDMSIAIIDGFLLYSESMKQIWELLDVRIFLRTNHKTAKSRREARSGYVTIEGFWEDPPGYVDNIVWPNYVKDHAFLFKNGDVEGDLRQDVCESMALRVMPKEAEGDLGICVVWASQVLEDTYTYKTTATSQ